jgi:hypothetical protein
VQAAFFKSWVSLFRVSAFLTLDRSVEFSSAVWSEMCSTLRISHGLTTAFHPQANGLEERIHRPLKDVLRVRLDNHWPSHLPWVLLGLRAAVKKIAPFLQPRWVYGEPLTLPGDFVDSSTPPPESFMPQVCDEMFHFQPQATRPGRPTGL